MGTHKSLRQQAAFVLKNMKVIGAYMLAVVGGNASPSAADCKYPFFHEHHARRRCREASERSRRRDGRQGLQRGSRGWSQDTQQDPLWWWRWCCCCCCRCPWCWRCCPCCCREGGERRRR